MTSKTNEAKPNAAAGGQNELLVMRLRPMSEAPKDGTEILAYHIEGDNFHPIMWRTWTFDPSQTKYWGMRWHQDYKQHESDYSGWVPYPTYGA